MLCRMKIGTSKLTYIFILCAFGFSAALNPETAQTTTPEVERVNRIVASALKEGAAAFMKGDYEAAITAYTKGLDADPNWPGSAPVLIARTLRRLSPSSHLRFKIADCRLEEVLFFNSAI